MPSRAKFDSTVYDAAFQDDNDKLVDALTTHGHLIDEPNPQMRPELTPIHQAAKRGNTEAIEILIRFGSKAVDTPDNGGRTPMFEAASNGHGSVIELLVRLGSKAVDTPRWTPLYEAAEKGHVSAIEALVRLGSNAIDTPNGGWTPLETATGRKVRKVLKALGTNSTAPFGKTIELTEDEAAEVRFRVYFGHSLAQRLLFEMDRLPHIKSSAVQRRTL